jgi:hypothetical protein
LSDQVLESGQIDRGLVRLVPVLKANGAVSKLWGRLADAPHVWAMRRRCNVLKIIDFADCAWRAAGAH